MADIDVRPVAVDKLVAFTEKDLEDRRLRLLELDEEYTQNVETAQANLAEAQRIHTFVKAEFANTELAQKLARGDVVRVKCPSCKGSGMKPADVMTGQISNQGSAFEGAGGPPTAAPAIDERNRCPACIGQRWQIMERFKG